MGATTTVESGRLGEIRRACGLTQIDLARKAGCSVSYVRQLEQGGLPLAQSELVSRLLSILNDESPAPNGAPEKTARDRRHESP